MTSSQDHDPNDAVHDHPTSVPNVFNPGDGNGTSDSFSRSATNYSKDIKLQFGTLLTVTTNVNLGLNFYNLSLQDHTSNTMEVELQGLLGQNDTLLHLSYLNSTDPDWIPNLMRDL